MPAPGDPPSPAEDAQEESSVDRALRQAESDLTEAPKELLGEQGASTVPKQ